MAIHWKAPTIITISLLVGSGFAIGHHLFYSHLNGQAVESAVFSQSINIGIGTAFAFLVRHALRVAVVGTFWQGFWGTLSQKSMKIGIIDSLAAQLSVLQGFANFRAFKAEPLLVLLAAVTWLLPIPTVVPPGTLTVTTVAVNNSQETLLPAIDFSNGKFASWKLTDGYAEFVQYTGPTNRLIRLGLATAIQGAIPNVRAPAGESSYSLKFNGPAIKCSTISDDILAGFQGPMRCNPIDPRRNCSVPYEYLSWAPNSGEPDTYAPYSGSWQIIPFANGTMNVRNSKMGLPITGTYGNGGSFISVDAVDGLRLIIAARNPIATHSMQRSDWSVVDCLLHNATHHAQFSFHGQDQSIKLLSTQLIEPITTLASIDSNYAVPTKDSSLIWGYAAPMEVLGKILVGSVYNGSDAHFWNAVLQTAPRQQATSAFQTNLAFTQELLPVYNMLSANASLDDPYDETNRPSLPAAVEELFSNFTLALFSEPVFLTKKGVLPTTITSRLNHNIYSYRWRPLLLAYGVQCGIASLIVLLGWIFVLRNQASYTNNFSTIMRATRRAELNTELTTADATGCDPLPKHIEKASLRIRGLLPSGTTSDSVALKHAKQNASVDERTIMIATPDSWRNDC